MSSCCHPQPRPTPFSYLSLLLILPLLYLFNFSPLAHFSVNYTSAPPVFFIFGLIAGFSTCGALLSSLVLSVSRQSFPYKFFLGRIISFAIFGLIFGFIGNIFHLSFALSSFLNLIVTLIMVYLGLNFLGFNLSLPFFKKMTLSRFPQNHFLLGLITFFIPCGFTLTAQSLALVTGRPLTSLLILFFFVLGTSLPLALIAFSGRHLFQLKYASQIFGLLILSFAIQNFYRQLQPVFANNQPQNKIQIINGVQVIKTVVTSSGYSPSSFQVKANVPVRWEIIDGGSSGCTNAILAKPLIKDIINLIPGVTTTKEFTPTTPGTYRFSCWMGMITGTIEVVE